MLLLSVEKKRKKGDHWPLSDSIRQLFFLPIKSFHVSETVPAGPDRPIRLEAWFKQLTRTNKEIHDHYVSSQALIDR